jgi:hypothetical protein
MSISIVVDTKMEINSDNNKTFIWCHDDFSNVHDCMCFYTGLSPVFASMTTDAKNDILHIPRTGALQNGKTFRFLLNLAHYSKIVLHKDDVVSDLYDIFVMACTFQLPEIVIITVMDAIVSKIDYSNLLYILNHPRIHSEVFNDRLLNLLKAAPVEFIGRSSTKMTDMTILSLIETLKADDVNCSEFDLFQVMMKKKWPFVIVRSCIRFNDMSFEELIAIKTEYSNVMTDSEYMTIFTNLNRTGHRGEIGQLYGFFPFHIQTFNQPVTLTLQSQEYTICFLTCTVRKNELFAFPVFQSCAGTLSVQLQTSCTHAAIKGQLNNGVMIANKFGSNSNNVDIEIR